MPKFKYTAKIYCPYYMRENDKEIMCEGFADSEEVRISFCSKEGKYRWQEDNCITTVPDECPVRFGLNSEYFTSKERGV